MLLYFKTKTCIQIEHSNIKLIFITYLSESYLFLCNPKQFYLEDECGTSRDAWL